MLNAGKCHHCSFPGYAIDPQKKSTTMSSHFTVQSLKYNLIFTILESPMLTEHGGNILITCQSCHRPQSGSQVAIVGRSVAAAAAWPRPPDEN